MNVNIFGRNFKKPMTMAARSKARSILPLEHWGFEFESHLGAIFKYYCRLLYIQELFLAEISSYLLHVNP
jgi:hypothetical protein